MVLQYFDEVTSNTFDIYDTTINASQNTVVQPATDLYDVYETTLADTNKSTNVTTDKQNPMHMTYLTHMTRPQTYSLTQNCCVVVISRMYPYRNNKYSADLSALSLIAL